MTEIEKKALALVNEIAGHDFVHPRDMGDKCWLLEALCRAIEQHEAFRQEVSDRIIRAQKWEPAAYENLRHYFDEFTLPKPDPLVKTVADYFGLDDECVSEMLKENGLKIVEDK